MSPGKGIRILSICDDDGIRFSREMVLKQEGYDVESVASGDPLDRTRIGSFHLAILCHSITPEHAAHITASLRAANPAIAVLRVHAIRSAADHTYDVDCEVLPGPGQLLSAINTLSTRFQPRNAAEQRKRA